MNEHEWAEVIGAIGLFVLVIGVVLMTIHQVAAGLRAKALLAREDKYKELAETSSAAQQNTERRLGELGEQLADIRTRMDSLERILKEVE